MSKRIPDNTAKDTRFTCRDETLYAIALGWTGDFFINTLKEDSDMLGEIADIQLLGSTELLTWQRTSQGLMIRQPAKRPGDFACAFRITQK